MKKTFLFLITLLAIFILVLGTAALADTLTLPAELTAVEDQAFFGDQSLGTVVLPEHLETIEFMRRVPLARAHIFPYSRRSGTKAAAMRDQLSNAEKSRRAGELIAVSRELEREYISRYVGKAETVLVEETKNGLSFGCTDTYVKTVIDTELPPNTLVRVQIDSVKEENDGELYLLSHRIG